MCVYVLLQTGNVSLQDLDQVFSWEQGAAEPNRIITVTRLTGQHRAPLDCEGQEGIIRAEREREDTQSSGAQGEAMCDWL